MPEQQKIWRPPHIAPHSTWQPDHANARTKWADLTSRSFHITHIWNHRIHLEANIINVEPGAEANCSQRGRASEQEPLSRLSCCAIKIQIVSQSGQAVAQAFNGSIRRNIGYTQGEKEREGETQIHKYYVRNSKGQIISP